MGRTLRVAVVGIGYWGPNLVRTFAAMPDVEVAWACDLEEKRLADITHRFRVGKTTRDVQQVIQDPGVDAVVLATPVASHRPIGEAALRAGKHLWIEKPLALSVADAEALVSLAAERDLRLLVDHTFVYTPAVRKIRELLVNDLGECLYFDSVRVNLGLFQQDTNVLWDLGPHDISIADYVLGRRPMKVSAVGIRHVEGATEDMAYVTLRYEGNLVAHFHFNWLAPVKVRLTMIGGRRRMIVYDDNEMVEKIKVYDKGIDVAPNQQNLEERARVLVSYRTGDMWSPRIDQTEALVLVARDFTSAIREGRAPISDGKAGLAVVQTLAAAQRSMELNGEFVEVPR